MKTRYVHPLYQQLLQEIFRHPQTQIFGVYGAIGLGKTTNFVILAMLLLSMHIKPTYNASGKLERFTKWVFVRETISNVVRTLKQGIAAVLGVEVANALKTSGDGPVIATLRFDDGSGIPVHMLIECYGMEQRDAFNRIASMEYNFGAVSEADKIPWKNLEIIPDRCGRYRTEEMALENPFAPGTYFTGASQLSITVMDMMVAPRADISGIHWQYEKIFGKDIETGVLTNMGEIVKHRFYGLPSPIKYVKITDEDDARIRAGDDRYALSLIPEECQTWALCDYNGNPCLWYPNKEIQRMTTHFEEFRSDVPDSGYNYWFTKLVKSDDSYVTTHLLGIEDTHSGTFSVYKMNTERVVGSYTTDSQRSIYVGFDPGETGAYVFVQIEVLEKGIKARVTKESTFDKEHGITNVWEQILDYLRNDIVESGSTEVFLLSDPAKVIAGRNAYGGATTSAADVLDMLVDVLEESHIAAENVDVPVTNTQLRVRRDSISRALKEGWLFIDKNCEVLIEGLLGEYRLTKYGKLNKSSRSSGVVEALQYVLIYLISEYVDKVTTPEDSVTYSIYTGD